MKIIILFILLSFSSSIYSQNPTKVDSIKIDLNVFGVEGDIPNIVGFINLRNDSSYFHRWFYNPKLGDNTYSLNKYEINKINYLLNNSHLDTLKAIYDTNASDEPNSTIVFYIQGRGITIKDRGLEGEYPLKELYQLIYRF